VIAAAQQKVATLLNRLNSLETSGDAFFDRLSNALDVPYSAEEATKDLNDMRMMLEQLQSQLNANLLSNLGEQPAESLGVLNTRYQDSCNELHRKREAIIASARKAQGRLRSNTN